MFGNQKRKEMSEIITIITQKPQWQTKIHDAKIVSKWKNELRAQEISGTVLDKAMELLKKSQVENYYGDIYKWHIEVGAAPSIWRGCQRCNCMICSEQEYLLRERNHYDENDEEYRDVQNTLKMFSKIKCKCQNLWVEDNLKFLRDNLYFQMNLVKLDLKQRFVTHVADFEARKTEKDYHPGSNDQMLDIIHPALYCFVKGVTPVVGDGEELMENTSLFQWIPSDFTVIRDPTTNEPIRTEIASYINNLDKTDPRNADLYQDISEIFTTMVPGFEKVLNKLQKDDRINALKKQTLYGFDDYGFEDEQDEETALSPPRQDIQLKDCQVIVKIASAQVNSDKPEFSEGSWHLEGVDSEKIIATGIYYYDMKDIEKSYLRFRTTLAQDMEGLSYPQDCPEFVRLHYGLRNFCRKKMIMALIL